MQSHINQSVPPVSAYKCKLDPSCLVGVHLRTCVVLHGYFLSVRPVDQLRRQLAHEDLLQVILCKARSRCISQGSQVGFEQIESSAYKFNNILKKFSYKFRFALELCQHAVQPYN